MTKKRELDMEACECGAYACEECPLAETVLLAPSSLGMQCQLEGMLPDPEPPRARMSKDERMARAMDARRSYT
ncbi:hypothetical protein FACS1894186_5270 [Alphaproteobacteria bacterium]|nr:hypothetical protein FACS1894186_5270 [Alphaproteobacteria bacterium]